MESLSPYKPESFFANIFLDFPKTIPFSHEMTSKNLSVGYFFSITHPFDNFEGNLLIFYYLGKYGLCAFALVMTQSGQRVNFAYLLRSRGDFNKSKHLIVGFSF